MAQIADKKQTDGLKLRNLDVSELRAYVSVTAGTNFDLYTDLKEDRNKIVSAIEARGASLAVANMVVTKDAESHITTYPPAGAAEKCAIVFPASITAGSMAEKSPAMQAIYAESEQGKLLRKYAAYHEGAHCSQVALMKELGIQNPITEVGRVFVSAVAEAYSDSIATMTYLRDLAKISSAGQDLGRKTLADFMELKFKSSPRINSLALDLVQALLELPQSQFENRTDSEIKGLARELVIDNAGAFLDRLKNTRRGRR